MMKNPLVLCSSLPTTSTYITKHVPMTLVIRADAVIPEHPAPWCEFLPEPDNGPVLQGLTDVSALLVGLSHPAG